MPMMTGDEYRKTLDDGRRVYLEGERVDDIPNHPLLQPGVDWIAEGYDLAYDPDPDAYHPIFGELRSKQDLRDRVQMFLDGHAGTDQTIHTTFSGSFAMLTASPELAEYRPEYAERLDSFVDYCRTSDLRVAEAITDSKGHRKLSPMDQTDPGQFVRVVDRSPDGVVISGAKLHITGAPVVHEMIIMPTKRFRPGEEDYAIACAVPMNADGVTVLNASYAPRGRDPRDHPVSSRHSMPDGFVVLDEVFVPNERIFTDGEVAVSAKLAHSLGLWERLGGLADMAKKADELVGLAQLIAEANGLDRVSHIREKISEMIIHATLLRASLEAAIENAETTSGGLVYPSELYTNAGKYHGAYNFNLLLRSLHDISGGAVVTAPSMADFENDDIADHLERYMSTMPGISGRYRTQLFHTIRDFTADTYGGWTQVTNLMAGGGMLAQRLVSMKHYDLDGAKEKALELFAHTLEEDAE